MGKARQTVERRQLGLALKRLRGTAGKSQLQAGTHIGVSASRVSKVEDAIATLDPAELEHLLDLYEVSGPERETVLALGVKARKRQPITLDRQNAYTDTLPGSFQRLADMEADARIIYYYEPGVIPGLLQCSRYMRAIMRAGESVWWPEFGGELETRASFRLERQARILETIEPRQLNFVFTDEALIDDGRHTEVLREQLEHLVSLSEKYSNITIRVLNSGRLDNPAPNGGIEVLDFGGTAPRVAFTPVVYGPSTYFTDDADTAALLRAFKRIEKLALSPERSMELIQQKLLEA